MEPFPAVDTGTHRRVALLADVHGNRWALAAVLAEIADFDVDAVYSLGCLTWGPQPRAVLALLSEPGHPARCLAGNGERAVLELADGRRAPVSPVDEWMVGAHGAAGVATLRAMPKALTLSITGLGAVRLCHGSPRSDIELFTARTPLARVEQALADVPERVVVHGHTHLQYQREVAGRQLAGCGSVGLPYSADGPAAYWTLLDADGVHPRRTEYDTAAAAADVLAGDYPATQRYAEQLLHPLDPEEITADAEAREFSD